jgi:recombination protein RecA
MAKKREKQQVSAMQNKADLISLIEKDHGAGSVMVGRNTIVNVQAFSTGVPSIDVAFGCKGLPQGRIIEIYGPESSGKTTACLQFIAACQKHMFTNADGESVPGTAAFIDAEHAFDPTWAERIGVNIDELIFSQPNSGEEALDIVEKMVKSTLVNLIVVDSVAALTPQVELDGELSDANVGAHARLMSKALRKLKGSINKTKTTVIFVNQIREKVGVMFGNPETTPGGRALKFYASIRAEVRRGSSLKDDDSVVGFQTNMKIIKNKVAPPFTTAAFDICVGHPSRPIYGIDIMSSLIDVALDCKVMSRTSSWISYGDRKIGNGAAAASAALRADRDLADEILNKTYNVAFKFHENCRIVDEEPMGSSDLPDLDNELLDND